MDTAAQHTDMAEVYIKRWEPQEDFHDIPDHVIDALAEAFESEEERRQAVWFDGRPVFRKRTERCRGHSPNLERHISKNGETL